MNSENRFLFRAWNKNKKEFVDDFILDRLGNYYQTNKCEFWGYDDDLILMQCTGLRDKNDVLIYEGDIVKYFDSFNMWLKGDVLNVGGAFAVKTESNPLLLYDFHDQFFYDGKAIPEIEVIGNIYEKPDLVKW